MNFPKIISLVYTFYFWKTHSNNWWNSQILLDTTNKYSKRWLRCYSKKMPKKDMNAFYYIFHRKSEVFFPHPLKQILYIQILCFMVATHSFKHLLFYLLFGWTYFLCYSPIHFWCSINLLLENFRWNKKS